MKIHRTVRTALHALRRNIMRAILTALGIIIGIAAVISMMEIGKGSADAIQRTMANMGADVLIIFPDSSSFGGVSYGAGSGQKLTPDDCQAIINDCPHVRAAAPIVRSGGQLVYGHLNWDPGAVNGTTPKYLEVRNWTQLDAGAAFTDEDVATAARVCLIGQTVARQLFPNGSPLGKEIRLQNVSFKIIGVLAAKGANTRGDDQDDVVIAPWTTIKFRVTSTTSTPAASTAIASDTVNSLSQLYPTQSVQLYDVQSAAQQADNPLPVRFISVNLITVAASSINDIAAAHREIAELLRERHQIRPDEPDDFQVRDLTEMVAALTANSDRMTTLLLSVACISLLVGGVGIMNIMLVSVTERTREIGLRMAVGARSRDILRQFLVEAVVLCTLGGIAGILLGVVSSYMVTQILHWPTKSSPEAIVAAVAVAVTVGISFGFYPAWKASRLDPIEALRYE